MIFPIPGCVPAVFGDVMESGNSKRQWCCDVTESANSKRQWCCDVTESGKDPESCAAQAKGWMARIRRVVLLKLKVGWQGSAELCCSS
jgi:hypothetical protein